jgi:NRPS condensation-like uncharacterized protein
MTRDMDQNPLQISEVKNYSTDIRDGTNNCVFSRKGRFNIPSFASSLVKNTVVVSIHRV